MLDMHRVGQVKPPHKSIGECLPYNIVGIPLKPQLLSAAQQKRIPAVACSDVLKGA